MNQKLIALFMMATAMTGYASAASYDELLACAVMLDKELSGLAIAEERAEIAYRRAASARDSTRFDLGIDGIEVGAGDSATQGITARPKASVSFPRGPSFSVEAPVAYDEDGFGAQATLSASLPLLRGPDETLAAAETAELAWIQARWTRESRRLTVEKELAQALKELASDEASVQEAIRAEAKARLAMEQARVIDGASPGGTAYLALERELRVKGSERRSAEAARARRIEALVTLTGRPGPVSVDELDIPIIDLGAPLPAPESTPSALDAMEAMRIAAIAYEEAGRRLTIAAKADGSLGDDPLVVSGSSAGGSSVGAGIALGYDDVEAQAGLGYRFGSGPTIGGSIAWKPRPRGERSLIERDRALVLELARAEAAKELQAAVRSIGELEFRRHELRRNMQDLAEDLRFAVEQRRVNEAWLDAGIVSDTDYAEVIAFEEGAKARDNEAALERIIWNIDRLLLSGIRQSDASVESGKE